MENSMGFRLSTIRSILVLRMQKSHLWAHAFKKRFNFLNLVFKKDSDSHGAIKNFQNMKPGGRGCLTGTFLVKNGKM